jgi:hypothetical protein
VNTNNELAKMKSWKYNIYIAAKISTVSLAKVVKELYNKNYKILKKEIEENTKMEKHSIYRM